MHIRMKTPTPKISAAHLTAPGATPAPVNEAPSRKTDTAAMFKGLDRLVASFGPKPNRNELVDTLIMACISAGRNTGKEIIGVLAHLGFNRKHVAIRLQPGDEVGYWRKSADGVYILRPDA